MSCVESGNVQADPVIEGEIVTAGQQRLHDALVDHALEEGNAVRLPTLQCCKNPLA